jgi:hypothetical protein
MRQFQQVASLKNQQQVQRTIFVGLRGLLGLNVATTRRLNDGGRLQKRQIAAQQPKKRRFQQVAGLKNQQQF